MELRLFLFFCLTYIAFTPFGILTFTLYFAPVQEEAKKAYDDAMEIGYVYYLYHVRFGLSFFRDLEGEIKELKEQVAWANVQKLCEVAEKRQRQLQRAEAKLDGFSQKVAHL